ncbi:hypothetical protein V6O07_20895, partial [Arthrospira platensis SPKY2]
MDSSFWQETFYYNTVRQWAWALSIALGVWLVSKLLYWISANVLRKVVERTNSRLDDILLETLQ